jgi:hypothetical protein
VHEEWRVSVIIHDPPTINKPVSARAVRDLLRGRVGDEISVSKGKTGIYLYAASADAAGTAERRAQEVLAEQGLVEDTRLERWDQSRRAWVDARTEPPGYAAGTELSSGQEPDPGRRRLRFAGPLIAVIIEAIGSAWPST